MSVWLCLCACFSLALAVEVILDTMRMALLQDDVKPQSSSWYGQGDVSDPIRPLRSKNITYSAAVKGVYSSVSYGPQTGSSGFGPVISVYTFGSDSNAGNQLQGSLIFSAGSGSLVSDSVETALGTNVSSQSVPQPAQHSSQTPVQTSNETVVSSIQQLMQTISQSSSQQLATSQLPVCGSSLCPPTSTSQLPVCCPAQCTTISTSWLPICVPASWTTRTGSLPGSITTQWPTVSTSQLPICVPS